MAPLGYTKIRRNKWVQITLKLFAWFTCGMVMCALQSTQVDGFTSSGYWLITGPEYKGISYVTTSEDQTMDQYIYAGDGKIDIYCGDLCARTANCSHFEINGNHCFLILVNLCERQNIEPKPNAVIYDLRAGTDPNRSKTCQQMCMEPKQCSECARGDNCYGNGCQDCKSYCWELNPTPPDGARNYRFFTPTEFHTEACDSNWHHIWPHGENAFNPYVPLQGLVLKVKVRVMNSEGELADFVFRNCSVDKERLTVGDLVSGTANPWKSPFQNRALLYPTDTNCKPFFYSEDVCSVSRYTKAQFIWKTHVPQFDAFEVKTITIWVAP